MRKLLQTAFDFSHPSYMEREDFIVAKCNEDAFKAVDSWPNWLYFALCLYGTKGCGKSHLANLFAQKVQQINPHIFRVYSIEAKTADCYLPENLFADSPALVIENLCEKIDNEAMFHLYNYYRDHGGYILFLSEEAPARLNFSLPDLQSRINAVPAIQIGQPDDEMLTMLLLKLFNDRQLKVTPEILRYAVSNMVRSFSYAQKLIDEADRISLIKKSPITVPVIKEAVELLKDNKQADLFEEE